MTAITTTGVLLPWLGTVGLTSVPSIQVFCPNQMISLWQSNNSRIVCTSAVKCILDLIRFAIQIPSWNLTRDVKIYFIIFSMFVSHFIFRGPLSFYVFQSLPFYIRQCSNTRQSLSNNVQSVVGKQGRLRRKFIHEVHFLRSPPRRSTPQRT